MNIPASDRRGPGRPPKEEKRVRVGGELCLSLAAKLDQLSRESGLSKRYLLEHALAQYLAKHSAAVVPSAG